MARRILTVDDDLQTTQTLKRLLETRGYIVREENDSTKALAAAREFQPDTVVLDYSMAKLHGGDVAWQLASDTTLKKTKVIMCSGVDPQEFRWPLPPVKIPILAKPVDVDSLLQILEADRL